MIPPHRVKEANEAYGFLDRFLVKHKYLATCHATIADFNMVSSVAVLEIVFPIDRTKFPNLAAWLKRMKNLPYFDKTNNGLDMLKDITKTLTVVGEPSSIKVE